MRRFVKLCFAAFAAALLFASAVTTASARTLSISNQNIRATWRSLELTSPLFTIRCAVTLEGSFHARTIAKVERSLVGYITRAIVKRPCVNGEGWADNGTEVEPLGAAPQSLPWHLTYEAFGGTLPNISSIDFLIRGFRLVIAFESIFGECIGRYGAATDNITARAARDVNTRVITSIAPVEGRNTTNLIEELGTDAICPASVRMRGAGEVMLLGNTARITVTLI